MTLNVRQDHSNWYQTIQFSGVYHHSKFERNLCIRAKLKFFDTISKTAVISPEKNKQTNKRKLTLQ